MGQSFVIVSAQAWGFLVNIFSATPKMLLSIGRKWWS